MGDCATAVLDQQQAASILDWWLLAGVDIATTDSTRDWLQIASDRAAAPAQVSPPPAVEDLPGEFDAFHRWLAQSVSVPLYRPGSARALPSGPAQAPIMLVGDIPGVSGAGELEPFGDPHRRLADRMLAAIGLTPAEAYVASLSCFAVPAGRVPAEELEACGRIVRAQLAAAHPARLLLMGDAPARALLGEPLPRARGRIHKVEGVRTVATFHPRWLIDRPADKALAWKDLLLLMEEE